MKVYDRGSMVLILASASKTDPGDPAEDFSGGTVQISITDQSGAVKVDAAEMTMYDAGKYFYKCQTGEDWYHGRYKVSVKVVDGSDYDVTTADFGLKF